MEMGIPHCIVDLFLNSTIATEIYNFAFMRARIGLGAALSTLFMINALLDLLLILGVFKLLSSGKRRRV